MELGDDDSLGLGEAPTCIKCERPITRRPGHAPAATNKGSGGATAASLWQQSQPPPRAPRQEGGEEGEEGDDVPMPLPPMASSFVMVSRMADMSMSFLHVQEAAAAAMATTTTAQQRGGPGGGGARREPGQGAGAMGKVAGLSEHLKRAETVLKYGSGQAPLDCPACVHCLDAMQQALDRALGELQREEAAYAAVIKGEGPGSSAQPAAALAELAAARAGQEEVLRALEEQFELSEAEAVGLERELREVVRQERAQEAEEKAFWRRLVGHELEAAAADQECADLLRDIARLHARAESLAPSSPFVPSPAANPALASLLPLALEGGGGGGDAKRGKEEDGAGSRPLTVNGFRLARREAPRRDLWWPEINAAWGQVVLLLNAVAHQVGFQSPRYRAVYLGASSRILQDPGLRSQLAFPLFVARRAAPRVDEGARRVCLLVAELQRHVLALDREERRMELHVGERLMDLDLSVGGLRDEAAWTTALARLVGCLRWLVRVGGAAMPLLQEAAADEGEEGAGEGP